jgi:predicted RNase H-like HicB family nuclease
MLEYHAAFYHDEDSGWYTVQLLDFPAVISQGKTLNSARRMIRDALLMMAEWYLKDGLTLPRPNPRARDRNAALVEPIRLRVQVQAGSKS